MKKFWEEGNENMNNFRWNLPLMGNRRGLFQRKRRGRMGMFLTALALGAGALWYGMSERQAGSGQKQRSLFKSATGETAFAEELLANVLENDKKE